MHTVLEIVLVVSLCFLVGTLCTAHLHDVLRRRAEGRQEKPVTDTHKAALMLEAENTDLRTDRKSLLREIDELRQTVIRVRENSQTQWDTQNKEIQRLKKELDKSHQRERHLEATIERSKARF